MICTPNYVTFTAVTSGVFQSLFVTIQRGRYEFKNRLPEDAC